MQYTMPEHTIVPLQDEAVSPAAEIADSQTPNTNISAQKTIMSAQSSSTLFPVPPSPRLGAALDRRTILRQRSRPDRQETVLYNPFYNETRTTPWHQHLKMLLVILTGLPLLRIVVMLVGLLLVTPWVWIIGCCRTRRLRNGKPVLDTCNDILYTPLRWSARLALWAFGYWWINENYPPGTPFRVKCGLFCCGFGYLRRSRTSRIVVANHTTFMDALFFYARFVPTPVGKASIVNFPLVGAAIAATQPILVPRTPADKARLPSVPQQLHEKATSGTPNREGPIYQPILIFPEGTTVNQKHVIQFQKGAFLPKVPVQPVAIDYPFAFLDVSMPPDIPNLLILGKMLCQLYNYMEVTYLPPVEPYPEESVDEFAERTRQQIASVLGRTTAPFSDRDTLYIELATRRHFDDYARLHVLPSCGVRRAESCLRIALRLEQIVNVGERFCNADSRKVGYLTVADFCGLLHRHCTLFNEKAEWASALVFQAIDEAAVEERGHISYKDVVNALSIAAHGVDIWSESTQLSAPEYLSPQRVRLCFSVLCAIGTSPANDMPTMGSVRVAVPALVRALQSIPGCVWHNAASELEPLLADKGGILTLETLLHLSRSTHPTVQQTVKRLLDAAAAALWGAFGLNFFQLLPDRATLVSIAPV